MGIRKIQINNFKSLKNININFNDYYDLSCFLGKNGAGKSNLLNAINYFYEKINFNYGDSSVLDNKNMYVQNLNISITYDFSNLLKKSPNKYIRSIIEKLKPYLNNKNEVLVEMRQDKSNKITWYPKTDGMVRAIINTFPIYFVNTRDINLVNWETLWDIASDLSKRSSQISDDGFYELLDEVFENAYGDKYKKNIQSIKKILKDENLNLDRYDYINRYKNILAVRFGGSKFISEGNNLDYYSDGLNSFRYLKLLIKFISKLNKTSWKEPILLIDEPEIGLHSKFIYELVDMMKNNINKNMNLFISTHSSELICELMKNDIKTCIYRIDKINHYSIIDKVNEFIDGKDKHRLTINEVKCYFADAIVMVEGTSDIEVFYNRKIRELYPKLREVEFYNMQSNNIGFKFVSPNERNFNIPYLVVVDMDKIIKPPKEFKSIIKYTLNADKDINPLFNEKISRKEKFQYYSKKSYNSRKTLTYDLHCTIRKKIKDYKFTIDRSGYYIKEDYHKELLEEIRLYCVHYNILPFRTTIEGALINHENYEDVLKWIKHEEICNLQELDKLLNKDKEWKPEDFNYRTTILRLICNGKYDSLFTFKNLNKSKDIVSPDLGKLHSKINKKTDGWINKWLNFFFKHNIDRISDEEEKRQKFESKFPELSITIKRIEYLTK